MTMHDDLNPLSSFMADVEELKAKAANFPKRRSDAQLYAILSAAMRLCDRADREGLLDQLKRQVTSAAIQAGKKRSYFEAGADAPLVIGRLIFEAEGRRTDACWRYSATIREARKRNISAEDLPKWLSENGGINALFRTRKVATTQASTRTIHLTSAITLGREGTISLKLRRRADGFFDVLEATE